MSDQLKLKDLTNLELVTWLRDNLHSHGFNPTEICSELAARFQSSEIGATEDLPEHPVEPFWMIVNIADAVPTDAMETSYRLPGMSGPRFMHTSRHHAESELLRLSKTYGCTFVMLEAVARVAQRKLLVGKWEEIHLVKPIKREGEKS